MNYIDLTYLVTTHAYTVLTVINHQLSCRDLNDTL